MNRLLQFTFLLLFFCQAIFCDTNDNRFQASFYLNAPYQYQLQEKQNNTAFTQQYYSSQKPSIHHQNDYGFGQQNLQQPFLSPMPIFSGTGKSKKQQKAELEKYVTNASNTYLQAGKDYFKGDISPLQPIIAKAVANKTINTPEVHNNLIKQAITHLVKTNQTDSGKVAPYKNHPWMQNHDLSKISKSDQIMINYMIARVSEKCNDTTVELVQTGLQAFNKAQSTTNNAEKIVAQNLYAKCYNTLQNHAQLKNIACNKSAVQKADTQELFDEYKSELNNYQLKNKTGSQPIDKAYAQRLEKRTQALEQDLQQHKTTTINLLPQITDNALGFMSVNNINYASFHNVNCTQFQHCVTKEIIGILNTSSDMAYRNGYAPVITQLAYYNCNLAVSAQQLNQLSHVKQAVTFTDICHFFTVYGQIMVDHEFQVRQWKDLGIGVAQGAAQALYKWTQFAEQLYDEPKKTIGKLSSDCYQVAQCLYTIAAEVGRFTPFAYLDDITREMQDNLECIKDLRKQPCNLHHNRMRQRTEQNLQTLQHGLYQALHVGQVVIGNMMEKSYQENIADITEFTIDGMIMNKATQALFYVSQFVGNNCLQMASSIQQHIPPHLLDSPMTFMKTNAGELFAVADSTGENIAGAIAAQALKIAENSTPFFQFAPQAKILADKIEELTQPNKVEVAALQKSLEPYLRTDKIVNIERLKSIEGIDQIKAFKDYTKNFHPDELAKLHPDEILYLNLCDWLEPQAAAINAELQKIGGLKIIDKASGQQAYIEKFDIFHSLLGEMKPGSVSRTTSGGHCFLSELRATSLSYGEIKPFEKGFFDMEIKSRRGSSNRYKDQTYFPAGKSINDCTDMLIDAIRNNKLTECVFIDDRVISFEITNTYDQILTLNIENNIAKFHPVSPFASKKL